MRPAEVIRGVEQGFDVVGLRSARAELRMVPALGGRVISLRSLRTGREWCWHRPGPGWLWENGEGDAFADSPQAGMDECLPTVSPCRVNGRDLPDHGYAWSRCWAVDEDALRNGVLQATLRLDPYPLELTRSIRVREEGAFDFVYTLANRGASPEPYLWCLHPLLATVPGDRLVLPGDIRSLRLNGGIGAPMALGDAWAYPEPFPGIRLDRLEVPGMPGGCVKAFAGPLREGYVAMEHAESGDRLELLWEAADLPFLGLWINRGHGGFHHVGLEPASGAPDALSEALEAWHQARVIEPGASVRWSVTIVVS